MLSLLIVVKSFFIFVVVCDLFWFWVILILFFSIVCVWFMLFELIYCWVVMRKDGIWGGWVCINLFSKWRFLLFFLVFWYFIVSLYFKNVFWGFFCSIFFRCFNFVGVFMWGVILFVYWGRVFVNVWWCKCWFIIRV